MSYPLFSSLNGRNVRLDVIPATSSPKLAGYMLCFYCGVRDERGGWICMGAEE